MRFIRIHPVMVAIFLSGLFSSAARAQAPSSIAGDALIVTVTTGTGVFTNQGYYFLLPASSSSNYQLIGADGVNCSSGTYSYSASNAFGLLNLSDSNLGSVSGIINFSTFSSGGIAFTAGSNQQTGYLRIASAPAPETLAGHSYFLNALDGAFPFDAQGNVIFTPAASGQNYLVFSISGGVANSSGTYSYSTVNDSTGSFSINDAATGIGTEYFAYSSSSSGTYLVVQPDSSGFQIGFFTVTNVVPDMFFLGQTDVNADIEYLQFPNGNVFGYYNVMDFTFPVFYHYDLGFEYFFDANDGANGAYLYDFSSRTFFYTSPEVFPYLYDFTLDTWLYYYPDTNSPGHYTTNPRYFFDFASSEIIIK